MNTKPFILYILLFTSFVFAQDYTTQWEDHFSYLSITGVSKNQNDVVASAENSVFNYSTGSQEIRKTSTVNGLSGDNISYYYYSENYNYSVIGYENGLLEIINDENEVTTVVDILNKPTIPPNDKKINHIYEYDGLVYLSCGFGISTYSLDGLEFADTYFIGSGGSQIEVNQVTIKDEYIYAATTANGIKRALHADPNIIDFSLWTTITSGGLLNWESIVTFNDTIYTINRNNRVIYEYDLTSFNPLFTYPTATLDHRVVGDKMNITVANRVYIYDSPFVLNREIPFLPEYGSNFTVSTTINNDVYVGTAGDGLLRFNLSDGTLTETIKPNGPTENSSFSVTADNNVWLVYGDHDITYNPFPLESKGFSQLKDDVWINTPYENVFDARSLVYTSINPFNKDQVFISSYYSGLLEVNDGVPTQLFDNSNSGLESLAATFGLPNTVIDIRVGRSTFDADGKLWLTNNRIANALKNYDPQTGAWQSFDISGVAEPLNGELGFGDLVADQNNNIWIASTENGLIGFTPNSGGFFKNIEEGPGNLPSDFITALAVDKDNNLWIGTVLGLRVLYNTSGFFSTANPQAESVIVLDDGIPKELMFGQFITDIEVDGSNNKWISTFDAGVFYFSSDGQETIYQFTKDNSPLPSNNITDMSVDPTTGKVYFATPKGLVAFKGLSKEPSSNLENVAVWPNPVRPHMVRDLLGYDTNDISKGIKIDGITEKVNIKITDISGKLVADANTGTQSGNLAINEGGFAVWNGRNFNNKIIASGVYIIMITDLNNSETTIEKVMIVR